MKAFINHFIVNNVKEVLEKSLKNCHCKGLHSIMLLDSPGKTIRMYITDMNHEMHPGEIAFHPHHCDLSLYVIKGNISNVLIKEDKYSDLQIGKYLYNSQITGSKINFDFLNNTQIRILPCKSDFSQGKVIDLKAADIHTIFCRKWTQNAWIVFEGEEDLNYKPYCYSNKNLKEFSSDGLYEKFSNIEEILKYINQVI